MRARESYTRIALIRADNFSRSPYKSYHLVSSVRTILIANEIKTHEHGVSSRDTRQLQMIEFLMKLLRVINELFPKRKENN